MRAPDSERDDVELEGVEERGKNTELESKKTRMMERKYLGEDKHHIFQSWHPTLGLGALHTANSSGGRSRCRVGKLLKTRLHKNIKIQGHRLTTPLAIIKSRACQHRGPSISPQLQRSQGASAYFEKSVATYSREVKTMK